MLRHLERPKDLVALAEMKRDASILMSEFNRNARIISDNFITVMRGS